MSDVKLTTAEAVAAGYGSVATLYRYKKAGKVRTTKKLGKLYFFKEDLDAMDKPCAVSEEDIVQQYYDSLIKDAPKLSNESKRKLANLLRPQEA